MSNIPDITIVQDLDKEVDIFLKFLNHPEFPQNRSMILKIYPKLSQIISEQKEELAVREFVDSFYQENAEKIEKIVNESRKSLMSSQEALKQLGILMDYVWSDTASYKAHPTILPFSPFRDDAFFFSILNPLFKDWPIDVLYIAVHEISHFIFLEQLKKIEEVNNNKFDKDLVYYYKESLTTVVLNQKEFRPILGEKEILGNPNIRDINIQIGEEQMSLIKYLTQEFETKKSYEDFLETTLLMLNKSVSEFIKKRELWNKNGPNIFEEDDLMVEYKKPIVI